MQSEKTFGEFIKEKRKNLEEKISAREMAKRLGVSSTLIINMENGHEPPPNDILAKIASFLKLNEQEQVVMYELATHTKKRVTIPNDVLLQISSNRRIRDALRAASKLGATDSDWDEFIQKLENKNQNKFKENNDRN